MRFATAIPSGAVSGRPRRPLILPLRPTTPFLALAFAAAFAGCAAESTAPSSQASGFPQNTLRTHDGNPLAESFRKVDPAFSFEVVEERRADGLTIHDLRMVSQDWMGGMGADPSRWRHGVTVLVPDSVAHDTGFLWITGGSSHQTDPPAPPTILMEMARATGSVVTILRNVPFQPIRFPEPSSDLSTDSAERVEDDLIAYGWRQFLQNGARDEDAAWLMRLPMTQAAMRAMDTVEAFTTERLNGRGVRSFVVGGASKRGWTAWIAAAFDNRVVGVVPVVIDLLNIEASFQHHWRSYGAWSPAVGDYEREGIMDWIHSAEFARLLELVDPYSYLGSLHIPAYIVNAGSDEFFLPDSWQFYWDALPGTKRLRYVPNVGHSLGGDGQAEGYVDHGTIAFYSSLLQDRTLPQWEWTVRADGFDIRFDSTRPPDAVRLWHARNPSGRDFRTFVIGPAWRDSTVEIPGDGSLFIPLDIPVQGYAAWFVEAVYRDADGRPFPLTTGVKITPDRYPFGPFLPDSPKGRPNGRVQNVMAGS